MPDAAPVLRVALPLPLPRLFDYAPPDALPAPAVVIGCRVRVPFGNRELVGVVEGVGPADPASPALRAAIGWLDRDPVLEGELLDSLRWLARYLHAPLGEVVATALPAVLRRGEPVPDTQAWAWQLAAGAAPRTLRGKPQALAARLQAGALAEALLDGTPGWRATMRTLEARGFVQRIAADPAVPASPDDAGPPLNPAQQQALDVIGESAGFAPILLDGVTGSGKTEVYLRAIADCLARGRQALVLVPEIGLTPQMLSRFRARLGVAVHALHSGLTDRQRAATWAAARSGQARVVVGTRSAVFLPLPHAGLIVVDEEHDASYKQHDGIRYHARDVALVRGKALGVPVVLGSATPALETLHNAHEGRYTHVQLLQRAGVAQPPAVRVLDIRKRPLQAGLSPELLAGVAAAIADGGQVLVFKNRRGYAPVLLCHDCGWSAQCRRCDAPMTVHGAGRRLQCHHCGARQPVPLACPDCASLALQPQGAGTERIEEFLVAHFPNVPVLRIDRGSTQGKDGLARQLATLGQAPGILVGTQMLAKGHDLPNLTLVAVVGVDEGLFSTDFRASEKIAQLLIQVAGRAGRAERPGLVLLQTHHPDHPLLHLLLDGGHRAFASAELAQRNGAGFPPYAHLALLRAEAGRAELPLAFLQAARAVLDAALAATVGKNASGPRDPGATTLQLHGPLPAAMARRAGMHRAQLLLSTGRRALLHAVLDIAMPGIHALPEARKVRWSLDVDPVDLY